MHTLLKLMYNHEVFDLIVKYQSEVLYGPIKIREIWKSIEGSSEAWLDCSQ